jgi:hypothetical protein
MQDSGRIEIVTAGTRITVCGKLTMKRLLIASVALLAAVSLTAQTEKSQQTTTTPESPLVAAAKKTNRAGKKRIVITDQSVKHSTGHITTTTIVPDVKVRPLEKPALQVLAAQKKAKEDKEKKLAAEREKAEKKAAAEKEKRMARMAAAEEDGAYGDDPAQVEHQADEQVKAGTTAQTAPSKPPDTKHP